MRVTKTTQDHLRKLSLREKANEGCYKCPGCGNTKVLSIWDAVGRGCSEDIITKMTFRVESSSLFKYKTGNVDEYKCGRCGTEWESEIY